MEFHYNDKVEIIDGFYTGTYGTVKFMQCKDDYLVDFGFDVRRFKSNQLKKISKWRWLYETTL